MDSPLAPARALAVRLLVGLAVLGQAGGCGGGLDDADGGADGAADGCPAGLTDCGSGCLDLTTDRSHCGRCGRPCGPGEVCRAGDCVSGCEDECPTEGLVECSGDGLRVCGGRDGSDGCLEWSAPEPCAPGLVCDPATTTCRERCGDFCEPFSVVLLPDTQYYTTARDGRDTYRRQMEWIVANREPEAIRFVVHLGDVTNDNLPEQWDVADRAHAILDAAGVPYLVVPGNHDYYPVVGFARSNTLFNAYFGRDRFEGAPWYGGAFGGGNDNTSNYALFEVGPMRFLVLGLEYAPRKEVLCWAEDVIAAHPDRRVIIATHCYLTHGGARAGGCPNADYVTLGAHGTGVWDELASRHENVFLVVSGHVGDSEYEPRTGNAGNTVHEMLVDYQFECPCSEATAAACTNACYAASRAGNGWLRQLVFDPRAGRVEARTLTVDEGDRRVFPGGEPVFFCSELYRRPTETARGDDWYPSDPSHQDHRFAFDYDVASAPGSAREDLGRLAFLDRAVHGAARGTRLSPRVALSPGGGFVVVWQDDSSAADGADNHDVRFRGFGPGGCAVTAEAAAHPDAAGDQREPAVAVDAEGRFVVVWADDTDDNGSYQVHARGFHADGAERFARFTVNTVSAGQQRRPAIGMAPDGRFVIAWEDDQDRDGAFQIHLRGFAADGTPSFAERSAHDEVLGERRRPALGLGDDGGFVVAWEDDSDANGTFQIHARGFAADGTERFARLTVNTVSAGQQLAPSVGVAGDGRSVVVWEDARSGRFSVMARGFDARGAETVAETLVADADRGEARHPQVGVARDGSFALGWADDRDGNGTFQIAARSFGPDGAERMADRTVNRVPEGQQVYPHVALDERGTLVFVWQDDMDRDGRHQVLARGFDVR